MTSRELVKWREQNGLTQREAGLWAHFKSKHAERSWRRYEIGERKIPTWLSTRIEGLPKKKLSKRTVAMLKAA